MFFPVALLPALFRSWAINQREYGPRARLVRGTPVFILTIFFPLVEPTFTIQPQNTEKFPQESVIFACNASGIPQPTITWFHNGKIVTTTGRIQINSKKELKFTSLQSGDKGTVQCVATNDAGEKIITATLKVKRKY